MNWKSERKWRISLIYWPKTVIICIISLYSITDDFNIENILNDFIIEMNWKPERKWRISLIYWSKTVIICIISLYSITDDFDIENILNDFIIEMNWKPERKGISFVKNQCKTLQNENSCYMHNQ